MLHFKKNVDKLERAQKTTTKMTSLEQLEEIMGLDCNKGNVRLNIRRNIPTMQVIKQWNNREKERMKTPIHRFQMLVWDRLDRGLD